LITVIYIQEELNNSNESYVLMVNIGNVRKNYSLMVGSYIIHHKACTWHFGKK